MEPVKFSRDNRRSKHGALTVLRLAVCAWGVTVPLWSGIANAQKPTKVYTRADYTDWLTKYANAKPDFKVGDVLTVKDLERMRPFVIPGYLDYLNFPEFKMRIVAPIDHTPLVDPQIWYDSFHVAFDHSGKLWKIFQWQWKWTETIPPPWDRYNKGVKTVTWQAVNDIDVQNNRGTIINAFGDGFPDVRSDLSMYQKRFDINALEEVHR